MRDDELAERLRLIGPVLVVLLLAIVAPNAKAAEYYWRTVRVRHCDQLGTNCWLGYERRRVAVAGYYRRRDDDDDYHNRLCLGHGIEVVSTEHTSEEHARDAARKLWMASTQWRDGGKYMDLDNAADIRWRCGPSNAMDTMAGKISETANKLIGRDGQNVRCQLWARPCELPREKDSDRPR